MEIVKAKELMVFDHIHVCHENNGITDENVRVLSTGEDYIDFFDSFGCQVETEDEHEAISGIVLTPEMLKANGFWTSNEHWYRKRVRENGVFDVCVSLDYKEIEITKICGADTDDEEADYGLSIEIGRGEIFVHKFQQILCIYDLFDLATNFKIE